MNGRELAERVAEAHGLDAWLGARDVIVRFGSGGLAFTLKRQPRTLAATEATISTHGQRVQLCGEQPAPWKWGIDDSDELARALVHLRRGRRRLAWSVEDVAAFAAAAIWTYTSLPFAAVAPGTELEVLSSPRLGWRRLAVRLPDSLTTHAPRHVLHVDPDGLVRRHDYTAVAFGRWARAAQTADGHRWFDGILVPTRRRVTPRLSTSVALSGPCLVWIDVHDVRVD